MLDILKLPSISSTTTTINNNQDYHQTSKNDVTVEEVWKISKQEQQLYHQHYSHSSIKPKLNDHNFPNPELITDNTLRRQFVVNMTLEAWKAYVNYAWGQASLKPLTRAKQKGWLATSGTTIVSSMSTLWLMGLMDEFSRGRKWIKHEMVVDDRGLVKIGALLSCYALTGDIMFRDKAQAFADLYSATGKCHYVYNVEDIDNNQTIKYHI